MGSDLYMEAQNWRPRKSKVTWDGDNIKVEKDKFYFGYETVYEGPFTPEIDTMLRGLGIKIPPRPGKMVRARLDFVYDAFGTTASELNTTFYKDEESMKKHLIQRAAEDYGLPLSAIRNPKLILEGE